MKERLDILLVTRGLAASREKAKAVIMAGQVYVDGQKEDKAGTMFDSEVPIEVRGNTLKYVSRGGMKKEKAMGHGQLDWKLRNDPRVVCMEKTNIRYVTPPDLQDVPQFSSIDVSFISLTKVLRPVRELLTQDGEIVCLIKPQFEAGREKVGKKGVVRDAKVHEEVIRMVVDFAHSLDFETKALEFSPIKGPEGNIEYLMWLKKQIPGSGCKETPFSVHDIVNEAHETLDN